MRELAIKAIAMSLSRYYKRIVFIPPAFMLISFIPYAIYERHTYKSEWLTAESMEPYEFAFLVAHCLIVSCLCLEIFFNGRSVVRGNAAWSFASWFLLPMLYFARIWSEVSSNFHDYGIADDLLALSATLPYLVCLTVTFVQFRRALKAPYPPAAE